MTMLHILRRLLFRTDGVAVIEAAIVFPLFLILTVGLIDLGMGMFQKLAVNQAAQAGAAYAVINQNVSGIQNVMDDAAGGLTVTATPTLGNGIIRVTAAHDFTPLMPSSVYTTWVPSILHLTSTITIRIK
jgi:Flp pilus assembly protein TadG